MGRYVYNGPFHHKFWFGIQPSDAASQFGGEVETKYISYCYDSTEDFNVDQLQKLLDKANQLFGQNLTLKFKDFGELERMLPKNPPADAPTKERVLWKKKARLLADIELGLKIYQSILEYDSCSFDAEL